MKLALGSDHAGFALKERIKNYLKEKGIAYEDFGPFSSESVDYPEFGHKVAFALLDETCDLGIVICGSGNGINMTVNKHEHVRGALCWEIELASLAKQHNDANVLTLPARFISEDKALAILDAFLSSEFEGGRHQNRVNKITIS